MCWDARTSFVTLGVGTLFNVVSFVTLRVQNSPASPFVLVWQYALLMQIPEGVYWLEPGPVPSRLAMLLNVTQPHALFTAAVLSRLRGGVTKASVVAILMYSLLMLTEVEEIWRDSESIAPLDGCTHLNLGYWNPSRATLFLTSSTVVLSELRPIYWAVVNTLLFFITFVLAVTIYTCGSGSVWCWFVFVCGPVLVIAEYARERVELLSESCKRRAVLPLPENISNVPVRMPTRMPSKMPTTTRIRR